MKFTEISKIRTFKLPAYYPSLKQEERAQVRRQYIEQQNGLCYHCWHPLDKQPADTILAKPLNMDFFPKGFLNYPVHLHHDHGTGLTIGAVHAYCNGVLWEYHGE